MAETKQNLPFRPLEVRGHGVWDPERKAFYPFIVANNTYSGKTGVRYYIHSVGGRVAVSGITAERNCSICVYINGTSRCLCYFKTPGLTQETDYFGGGVAQTASVLTDPNSGIIKNNFDYISVVFAEIPDDISGQ